MSYPVFTSWNEYVGTDGLTRTLDWSTPDAMRGQLQLGYLEALLQACNLRYTGAVGDLKQGYSALEQDGGIGAPGSVSIYYGLGIMDAWYAWQHNTLNPGDASVGFVRPSYATDLSGLVFSYGYANPPTGIQEAMFSTEVEILAELGDAERFPFPDRVPLQGSPSYSRPGCFYAEWAQQIKRCFQQKTYFLCGHWSMDYPTVEFDYAANPMNWYYHPDFGSVKGDLYEILSGNIISKFYTDYEYGVTGPVPRSGTGTGFHVLKFGDIWPLGA